MLERLETSTVSHSSVYVAEIMPSQNGGAGASRPSWIAEIGIEKDDADAVTPDGSCDRLDVSDTVAGVVPSAVRVNVAVYVAIRKPL
jgi:hypothetical protein